MTTDTPDKPKTRTRRDLPITIPPLMVSEEVAAAMLAQIGERSLQRLVAEGRLTPRQVTKGRTGYLVRELEAFCNALPAVTPGRRKPQGDQTGG